MEKEFWRIPRQRLRRLIRNMFRPDLQQVQTVLCLGAHSDDIEIGCGGTLMELFDQNAGVNVHWIVLSGGGQRAEEARQSAERFLSRGTAAELN